MADYSWEQFEEQEPKKKVSNGDYHWSQFEDEGHNRESYIQPISPKYEAIHQLKKANPNMPDWLINGLVAAVGTEPHPGLENFANNIAEPVGKAAKTAALALILGRLAGKTLSPLAKLGWNSLKYIPQDIKNIKQYAEQPKLSGAVSSAEQEAQRAKEAYEAAQEQAQQNHNANTSGALRNKSMSNLNEAEGLREKFEGTPEIDIPHNRPQYEGQHLTKGPQQEQLKALTGLMEAEQQVPEAEQAHEQAISNLEEATQAHQQHLGAGRTHNVHLGKGIKQIQEEIIKPEIQAKYKMVEENAENKGAMVDRNANNEQLLKDIRKSYEKAPGLTAEEREAAAQKTYEFNKGPEYKEFIPAKEVIANYRSYRDFINNQFRRSRTPGLDAKERQAIEDSLPEMRKNLDSLEDILEKTLGTEDYNLFKEANREWKEKITPTYGNSVWREIYKHGRTSDNFIKSTAGEDPGNVLAKNIVKSSPELLRHAVGQRVATNPQALHGYNEALEEYTNLMPELNKITNAHRAATQETSQAESVLRQANRAHAQAKNRMAKADRDLTSAENQQKSLQNQARKAEKEEVALTKKAKERKEALEEILRLEKLAKQQQEESIRLKEAKKQKNISLREKMKLEKEYKYNEAAFRKTKIRIGLLFGLLGIKKYLL